jgi:hypothetical protein
MAHYSFLTEWKLKADIHDVWKLIVLTEDWPSWWKGVKQAKVLRAGDEQAMGSVTFYEMGAFLYSIKFTLKVTETAPGYYIYGVAEGDLIGAGLWELAEENGIVTVRYYWNVETTIRWMNSWAWLLKPFFSYSHKLVMRWGGEGIAKKLGTKLISFK